MMPKQEIYRETQSESVRKRDLAKIHIAKKELGLDDETYRDILEQIAGVRSSALLDEDSRILVIKRFKELGFKPAVKKECGYRSVHKSAQKSGMHMPTSADRAPLLSKIGAILADQKISWAYADGMAKKMFGVDRVRWLHPDQLSKVAVALIYHQKRKREEKNGKR
jgi:phage gp16-like protein